MTISKVYLVCFVSNGDDYSVSDICVFMNEAKANEFVDRMNQLEEFNEEFSKRISSEFDKHYNEVFSHKKVCYPERPNATAEFVFWNSKKKNNDQEKLKYSRLQKEHFDQIENWKKEIERLYAVSLQQQDSRNTALEIWIKNNYHPPPELSSYVIKAPRQMYLAGSYSVKELELRT